MNEGKTGRSIDAAVVLCRVREAGNLGSICRAMKTMGLTRLLLADCPDYDKTLVRTMAVHAADVFENAQRYSTLKEALYNFSLSAGFTRRSGAKRGTVNLPVRDFAKAATGIPVPDLPFVKREKSLALVFGNERDGLSDQELALCSLSVHIPSSDSFPSLNVAQAVQIACYELFTSGIEAKGMNDDSQMIKYPDQQGEESILSRRSIEQKVDGIIGAFAERGAFKQSDDSYLRGFLRDLCERAGIRQSELEYLHKTFFKAFALGLKSEGKRRPQER